MEYIIAATICQDIKLLNFFLYTIIKCIEEERQRYVKQRQLQLFSRPDYYL